MVTDQDFNALAEWVDRKSALQRFLHGWGIVCGLEITLDPCDSMSLCISAGYAIDCCGRDLVVCDPICLSLSSQYCSEAKDPCSTLQTAASPETSAVTPSPGPGADYGVADGIFTWVNIYARYDEQLDRPQRQPSSSSCSPDASVCQYTRVRQVPQICTQAAALVSSASADVEADADDARYRTQVKAILEDLKRPENAGSAAAVRGYLAGAYKRRFGGLHHFAFLSALAEKVPGALPGSDSASNGRLAFWLLLDWTLSHAAACAQCDDVAGVPLARVLVRKDPETRACSIVHIDPDAPWRRPLATSTAPLGAERLTPYLWRPVDAGMSAVLEKLGITRTEIDQSQLSFGQVEAAFAPVTFWKAPGDTITARTVKFPTDQERIALFQKQAVT
jgi:hypothetical protein